MRLEILGSSTARLQTKEESVWYPTFTDVIASNSEPDFSAAADAVEQVAQILRCGVRPLPTEVSRALSLCGSPVVCNQLDLQDLRQKGPGFAKQLSDCAVAMRRGDDSQMERAREAARQKP